MAEKINKHCAICGKGYHICMTCRDMKATPWRQVVDTMNHYQIFLAIHGYSTTGDAETASKELEKCDLSDADTFTESIKEAITAITGKKFKAEKATEKTSKKESTKEDDK